MPLFELLRGLARTARTLPGIYHWRRAAYIKRFRDNLRSNMFLGVFDTFEEAAASAPATRPVGYDNPQSASMYVSDEYMRMQPHDYPAALWLARSLHEGHRGIADLGGSVGIKFYAFSRVVDYPSDMRWTVIEVPAVVKAGVELSDTHGGGPRLMFCESRAAIDGAETLIASGSLQYLPRTLADILRSWEAMPRRIIVNATPLHESRSFYTLNSIGTAFCPYRVSSRAEFVAELSDLGYSLRDEWRRAGKLLRLPFDPGYGDVPYCGFCFDQMPRRRGWP